MRKDITRITKSPIPANDLQMALRLHICARTRNTRLLLTGFAGRLNLVHDPLAKMLEVQAHFTLTQGVPKDDVHEGADLGGYAASERGVDVVALVHGGGDGAVADGGVVAHVVGDYHGDGFAGRGSHCDDVVVIVVVE
jgi:hypothetical protein